MSKTNIKKQDLFKLSASEISLLTKNRQISPIETTQAFIEKIQECNQQLNAVTETFYEEALAQAQEQTKTLMHSTPDDLPLFFGVPITVKEMFAMRGARRTAGNFHHQNDIMNFDSTVVQRLKTAGAIPLCTTNVPELGLWIETDNVIYGRTNNPYDLSRTSGGSSGGESALIGAGASTVGLGSDIGGSIRMPAAFCGIFGHKPTWRYIPKTGHFPNTPQSLSLETAANYSITTMGFLTKKSEDLKPLLELLSGPDGFDPMVKKNWQSHVFDSDLKKIKIYSLPDPDFRGARKTEKDLVDSVNESVRFFEQSGAKTIPLDSEIFQGALQIWSWAAERGSDETFQLKMTSGKSINVAFEILKCFLGQSNYSFPALVTCLLERINKKNDTQDVIQNFTRLKTKFDEIFDGQSLLILPVHPRLAPKHKIPYFFPFDFIYTGIFNAFGYPATSIPMGINQKCLPLSVQIVSGLHQDGLNFWAAQLLEKEFGGWTEPKS